MLANIIEYLLGLDKIIWTWGFKKCLEFGSIFYLGAFEGAVIYAFTILLAILKVYEARKKGEQAK